MYSLCRKENVENWTGSSTKIHRKNNLSIAQQKLKRVAYTVELFDNIPLSQKKQMFKGTHALRLRYRTVILVNIV